MPGNNGDMKISPEIMEIMERYEYYRVFLLKTSGLYICSRFEGKKNLFFPDSDISSDLV